MRVQDPAKRPSFMDIEERLAAFASNMEAKLVDNDSIRISKEQALLEQMLPPKVRLHLGFGLHMHFLHPLGSMLCLALPCPAAYVQSQTWSIQLHTDHLEIRHRSAACQPFAAADETCRCCHVQGNYCPDFNTMPCSCAYVLFGRFRMICFTSQSPSSCKNRPRMHAVRLGSL